VIGACSVWPRPFRWPRSSSLTGSFPKVQGKQSPYIHSPLHISSIYRTRL
jgi:hypothetical protein